MDIPNKRYKEKEKTREKHQTRTEQEYESGCLCPFCGAEMDIDDMFCTECGFPRSGITCRKCGALNFGSFCSHCNDPLDSLAQEALRMAKSDPYFREAERIAGELAELEKIIANLSVTCKNESPENSVKKLDTSALLSDSDRKALEKYVAIFARIGDINVRQPVKMQQNKTKDTPVKHPDFNISGMTLDEAVKKYKAVAEKLQSELNAMLPDPAATPQEQRNFFSARKITSAGLVSVRQCWVCNYCGCRHNQPSECYKPWMGGKWIMSTELGSQTSTTLYD